MEDEHAIDPLHYDAVMYEFRAKAAESEGKRKTAAMYYFRAAQAYMDSSSDDTGAKASACIEAAGRCGWLYPP